MIKNRLSWRLVMATRNQWLMTTASTVASTVAFAGVADAQSAPPPMTNWAGWYAGLNLSVTSHHASTEDVNGWGRSFSGPGSPPYVTPFFDSKTTTAGFGGQVGYNWQSGRFLTGLEADAGYVGAKATFTPANTFFNGCGTACMTSATNELTWLVTFRGRGGFLVGDNVLLYGTAGLALGGIDNHWGYSAGPPFSDTLFRSNGVRAGFVYGGGIEFAAMKNWVARAELLHTDFGTSSATIVGTQPFAGGPGTFTTNFKNTATIGRAALSWRW
jgi:outer membrane immunogenic protein